MRRSPAPTRNDIARAFTLVELLVVIGIIALLISILLPALSAAKRQANAAKCLTQLREIGNAFQMYALESKGFYPPSQLHTMDGVSYNLDGVDYPVDLNTKYGAYWFNFLNKYVTKTKLGQAAAGEADAAQARRSVFWGCPSWEGYNDDAQTRSINRLQVGYGMNGYPTFTADYPKGTTTSSGPFGGGTITVADPVPAAKEWSFTDKGSRTGIGTYDTWWASTPDRRAYGFVKQNVWGRQGATRCVVADSRFWLADSHSIPATKIIPPQYPEKNSTALSDSGQTYIPLWRHGKMPQLEGDLVPVKGKMAYNILYADGHCATATEATEAFRSVRMKFPG